MRWRSAMEDTQPATVAHIRPALTQVSIPCRDRPDHPICPIADCRQQRRAWALPPISKTFVAILRACIPGPHGSVRQEAWSAAGPQRMRYGEPGGIATSRHRIARTIQPGAGGGESIFWGDRAL